MSVAVITRGTYVGEAATKSLHHRSSNGRNYARFLLEYDDWRSGSFEPLRKPHGQRCGPGLISTKRTELEPIEAIVQRIEEASHYFRARACHLNTVRLWHGVGGQPDIGIHPEAKFAWLLTSRGAFGEAARKHPSA